MKKALLAASLLGMAAVANAGTVTMPGGISFEELPVGNIDEGQGNFNMSFDFVQWWEDGQGNEVSLDTMFSNNPEDYSLSGYGELTGMNGGQGKFNCNGCEMTFTFEGLGLDLVDVPVPNPAFVSAFNTYKLFPGNANATVADFLASDFYNITLQQPPMSVTVQQPGFDLGGASMKIFVDYNPDLDNIASVVQNGTVATNETFAKNSTSGLAWLEMSFNQVTFTPNISVIDPQTGLPTDGVLGLSAGDTTFGLKATGGEALSSFANADDLRYLSQAIDIFSDMVAFGLTSNFINTSDIYSDSSTGNARGIAVTEPATLAIFGLGLLGFAGAARRKQAK